MTVYRIEPFTRDRLPDVHRLHREVFRTRLSLDELRLKYDCTWTGATDCSTMLLHEDRLVGFFGALPQRFRLGRSTAIGTQLCDAAILREHRKKGLLQRLTDSSLEVMRLQPVAFSHSFFIEATFRIYRSMGWQLAFRLERFEIPVTTPPIASAAARSPLTSRIWRAWWRRVCRPLASPPVSFHNSFAATGGLHLDYAPDYLAYRCFTPNVVLRFGTATAWVRGGGALWVGDLAAPDEEAHDRAVEALIALARRVGSRRLIFQTSPGGPLARRLRRRFEAREGFPVGYLPLTDGIDFSSWGCNFSDLDTF